MQAEIYCSSRICGHFGLGIIFPSTIDTSLNVIPHVHNNTTLIAEKHSRTMEQLPAAAVDRCASLSDPSINNRKHRIKIRPSNAVASNSMIMM